MGQVGGKVGIVTGGASVIGAACAATLPGEGAVVVVTDIDEARGAELVIDSGIPGGQIARSGPLAARLSHE